MRPVCVAIHSGGGLAVAQKVRRVTASRSHGYIEKCAADGGDSDDG